MGDELTALLAPYDRYVVHVKRKSDRPVLYVGRGPANDPVARYGNPHVMADKSDDERLRVVREHFEDTRAMDATARAAWLAPVKAHLEAGGVLGCWCAPKWPCHGQVLAFFALHGDVAHAPEAPRSSDDKSDP
jgi:hypothetical protein